VRPGGRVVVASWTPAGFFGRLIGSLMQHMPPPPGVASPLAWGDERLLRTLLGGQLLLDQEAHTVELRAPCAAAMIAEFERAFGPLVLARKALGDDGFAVVRDDFRALVEHFDAGEDSTRIPSEYLLTVAHRP
jgi:hypothetical protein